MPGLLCLNPHYHHHHRTHSRGSTQRIPNCTCCSHCSHLPRHAKMVLASCSQQRAISSRCTAPAVRWARSMHCTSSRHACGVACTVCRNPQPPLVGATPRHSPRRCCCLCTPVAAAGAMCAACGWHQRQVSSCTCWRRVHLAQRLSGDTVRRLRGPLLGLCHSH
jgi:hypothetical protein